MSIAEPIQRSPGLAPHIATYKERIEVGSISGDPVKRPCLPMSYPALILRMLLFVVSLFIRHIFIFVSASEPFLIYIILANPRWFRGFSSRTATDTQKGLRLPRANKTMALVPGFASAFAGFHSGRCQGVTFIMQRYRSRQCQPP